MLCNAEIEIIDHLFFSCAYVQNLCCFLSRNFDLPSTHHSVSHLWCFWRSDLPANARLAGDVLIRSLIWNIWLERNAHMFRDTFYAYTSVLFNYIHMLLIWINAVPKSKKARLEERAASTKFSLDFLTS